MRSEQSKRFQWIDNARVIAALLIMFLHIGPFLFLHKPIDSNAVYSIVDCSVYAGRIPFFLILAGYFLARNVTWRKAWSRFLWLFIPYVIWNTAVYIIYSRCGIEMNEYSGILGIGSFFKAEWGISSTPLAWPVLTPTWFLRDIMLLSLLTPILKKIRFALLPALLLCLYLMDLPPRPDPYVTLSVITCIFYTLGVCLSHIRPENSYRLWNPMLTPLILLAAVTGIAIGLKNTLISGNTWFTAPWRFGLLSQLLGVLIIAYAGILIEKHAPRLSAKLAVCAPACFLIFVLHYPIYTIFIPYLPDYIKTNYIGLLIPIPVFFIIIGIFLLMKKYAPRLLPWLAHVK